MTITAEVTEADAARVRIMAEMLRVPFAVMAGAAIRRGIEVEESR